MSHPIKPMIAALAAAAVLLGACAATGAARSDESFAQIQRGMSRADVQALFGPPDEKMPLPLSRTDAWDYRYQDTWGYVAMYSITFGDDGRVVSAFSRRINVGGDHGSR